MNKKATRAIRETSLKDNSKTLWPIASKLDKNIA